MNLHQKTPDQLSRIFLALAHPVRRKILSSLTERNASVQELAEPFDISLVAIIKHLKILEKGGLIKMDKVGQLRMSYFQPEPLKEADAWMKDYRQFWDESFDKLDEYIVEHKKKEKNDESTTNQ